MDDDMIPDWTQEDEKELLKMAMRRHTASKLKQICPKCGSEQVQLKDWYTDNLLFKCRRCPCQWRISIEGEAE